MNADSHPHHARAHAVWSASATSRNVVCSGAIAMATLCEDRESEAAAWGSCCHQISERCLRGNLDAVTFLGDVEKSGKFEFPIDEEMCNTAQTYVDYCRGRLQEYRDDTGEEAQFWIEEKLSLDSLNPPLQAGGTGDFIIYFPRWRLLEDVDLKAGRGVIVDVKGNPQGRSYGIEAILTLKNIVVDRVRVTIVQPRVGNGEPKFEEFHVSELLDWTVDLLVSMQRAKDALGEFGALGDNRVLFDEWAAKWLATGQCTFCAAQAICPKRRQEALSKLPKIAREWHEDVTLETAGRPVKSRAHRLAGRTGSPEELAHDLDGFEAIESWIKSRRAYAHSEAERGVTIPGYQLADKIGNRAWKDEKKAIESMQANNMSNAQIFENKLRSPAQIEKVLGAARKKEIESLIERPIRGTNLVAVTKTTRTAAKSLTERHHETVDLEK